LENSVIDIFGVELGMPWFKMPA